MSRRRERWVGGGWDRISIIWMDRLLTQARFTMGGGDKAWRFKDSSRGTLYQNGSESTFRSSVGRRADALNQDMPYSFEKRRWKWERIALRGCFRLPRARKQGKVRAGALRLGSGSRGQRWHTQPQLLHFFHLPPLLHPNTMTPKKRLLTKVSGFAHTTDTTSSDASSTALERQGALVIVLPWGLADLVHAVAIASTVAGSRISNVVCELGDYLSCPSDHGKLHSCHRGS